MTRGSQRSRAWAAPLVSRVERRVRAVREREAAAREGAATAARAFRFGYLVQPGGGTVPVEIQHWPTRTIGAHAYHLHPETVLTRARSPHGTVVLLGVPVDVDRDTCNAAVITGRLAATWTATGDPDAVVRDAAYLGGRWTLLLHPDQATGGAAGLTAITDPLASQPLHHAGRAVASHRALLGDLPHCRLSPNEVLELADADQPPTTRRYWPFTGRAEVVEEAEVRETLEALKSRLVEHTRLLSTLGRPGIQLTRSAGTRAVLAAYLAHPQPGALTLTRYDTQSAQTDPAQAADLFAASEVSARVGMPHRALRWIRVSADAAPAVHTRTFPGWSTFQDVFDPAGALPEDLVELLPTGSELAEVSPVSEEVLGPWLAEVGVAALRGYDAQDLYRWEHAPGVAEVQLSDLRHLVLLPFNDRRILELLVSLPTGARQDALGLLAGLP